MVISIQFKNNTTVINRQFAYKTLEINRHLRYDIDNKYTT
jgi:hypothetical protein